jgi:hypothetical protein
MLSFHTRHIICIVQNKYQAYPNLLGTKRLGCCCCCTEQIPETRYANLHREGNLNSYTSNDPSNTYRSVNTTFVLCDYYALEERQPPLVGPLLKKG